MGNDILHGYSGGDIIFGDMGYDEIYGGAGNDALQGGTQDDTLWSNTGAGDIDQPYLGEGGTAGWNDMRHTGQEDCDLEDGHEDLDPECSCSGAAAPVDDEYHTLIGQTLIVPAPGVLANDSGPGTLTAQLHWGPTYGSVTLNTDGSFTYTPQTGVPYDQFAYTIPLGCYSNFAIVTIVFDNYGGSGLALDQPEKTAAAPTGQTPDCGCASGGHQTPADAPSTQRLEMCQLAPLRDAAIERWSRAGVDQQALAAGLANLTFVIADLSGNLLGKSAADGTIFVDINAAGHGWFLDATPLRDEEFTRVVSLSQRDATGGAAAEGADLLSVLAHEIGHVLGLEHDHGGPTNLMNDTIGLGMRRNPTAWDAAIVDFRKRLTNCISGLGCRFAANGVAQN